MQEQTNEVFHIVGTDLLDYSFKVEKAIKDGWTFSDKNEYAPRAWPHMFEAFMVKDNTAISEKLKSAVNVDTTEVKKVIDDAIEQVASVATNVAEKATKQGNRRGVKK